MLDSIKSIISKPGIGLEIYEFNSKRKSIHTDFVNFVGFDLSDIPEGYKIRDYQGMNYEDYTNSIDANNSYAMSRDEFNERYPGGVVVVIIED